MKLKVVKIHKKARIPSYANNGDACFDISTMEGGEVKSGHGKIFRTGLSFEIPPGWVMKIYSRSGHGFNKGVRLANCVGVIDAGYRGELKVKLFNDSEHDFEVRFGDRIAQAMLERVETIEFEEVEELSDSHRGTGGFGSSGA